VRRALFAAVALGVALPARALAQGAPLADAEGVGTGVTTYGAGDWFGLGLRLALVVAVIWAAVVAIRWYSRRVAGVGGTSRVLQHIETRTLGPGRSVQVLRVGQRAVVIGVTPERITQLLAIDDPEEVERLSETMIAGRAQGTPLDTVAAGIGNLMSRLRPEQASRDRARDASMMMPPLHTPTPFDAGATPAGSPASAPPSMATQAQAAAGYRRARIAELQRAIEHVRSLDGVVRPAASSTEVERRA
jgi:flagellar biogenesis protein FliO